jgi:hypothetical protein
MSQPSASWKSASEPQKLGDHPDYLRNLSDAKLFIRNTQKSMLEGLSINLTDDNRVLMIGFRPPRYHPMGNYAAPINLHQNRSIVSKETEWYFNYHYQLAVMFVPKQASIAF